jgi:hypothetical protein
MKLKAIFAALTLLGLMGKAEAQNLIINCQGYGTSAPTACTTVGPPIQAFTGDPGWLAMGKINSNFASINGTVTTINSLFATPIPTGGSLTPVFRFPQNTSQGYSTFVGIQAGINYVNSAIETSVFGYGAGGSGGNVADGLGGGTGLTGVENSLYGWFSGSMMTTGAFNTAYGVNTLGHESTGSNNAAFGVDTMRDTVGVSNSVAFGFVAMRDATGVSNNAAFGVGACRGAPFSTGVPSTTVGSNNTCIGFNAMTSTSMTSAANNVALGTFALENATTATLNVCEGVSACLAATTAAGNTVTGYNSGTTFTAASDLALFGQLAGQFGTGNQNTALGSQAFTGVNGSTSGAGNTAVGYKALNGATTGNNNTCVGTQVCPGAVTGNNNVVIGTSSSATLPTAATSNWINLDNGFRGGSSVIPVGNITSCGSGPTIDSRSTDIVGSFTTGSATTTCTLTINHANNSLAPICVIVSPAGSVPVYNTTDNGSTATYVLTTAVASTKYNWICGMH